MCGFSCVNASLLRTELLATGLGAGPESIGARLPERDRVSRTTIWRILTQAGAITPQPQKRPRSSWRRFEAAAPNAMRQSDFTHIRLADGTDTEVISWLDDHSRFLLHITSHRRITGPIVVESFLAAADAHGLPAATLTDNGMVYTTRLSHGARGRNNQPNAFEVLIADLGIVQKNGRPGHPTTQGKIERFHQTLKRWLTARPPAPDLERLQELLTEFISIYNTRRPHRALGRATPHTIYTTSLKTPHTSRSQASHGESATTSSTRPGPSPSAGYDTSESDEHTPEPGSSPSPTDPTSWS